MKTIQCVIREVSVEATPEELVRQKLLCHMIGELGYPSSYIAVEKGLRQIPHLSIKNQKIPERRADIICFAKGVHPQHELYPLLLIECKAVKLTAKVINQVTGYNHFLQSFFIAISNQKEVQTGWYDATAGKYQFVPGLPSFERLTEAVHST